MQTFGWAFIGCGGIAHITARELVKSGDQRIVAAWNRTGEKARRFVETYGGTACATIEETLAMPGVDGVYIAVTPDKHVEYMKLCIAHHKPVLCEKPFTVNAGQAREIFAYAAREGVYVSEAMWTWHNAAALQVKRFVASGQLGRIQRVEGVYAYPLLLMGSAGRLKDPKRIGGALLDIGVYAVRYCYELFGMPRSIQCRGSLRGGVDLGEEILLQYDGFCARLTIAMDRFRGECFRIQGSEGRVKVPQFHAASRVVLGGRTFRDKADHYAVQFANVAGEIRAGYTQGQKVSARSTVDCMELLDECRRQMGLVYPGEIPAE